MSRRDSELTGRERILAIGRAMLARTEGEQAAKEFVDQANAEAGRRAATKQEQAVAQAISQARVRRGEGTELDEDRHPRGAVGGFQSAQAGSARPDEVPRRPRAARAKQAARERKKLGAAFQRRHLRDRQREAESAAVLTEKVFQSHGIRHHYRPLPKVAWFAGYMAGLDRNGTLALQTLRESNMPEALMARVLKAAYEPHGYTPKRNVCVGARAQQRRYVFDGRVLSGGKAAALQWERDGERAESHPGAIRVMQVAVFLWLAKTRSRRGGYSFKVRGFGRGLFTAMCRCGKDSVFGHSDGVPGAMRALAQAGFIEYGQPPAQKVSELDRGPTGHAYHHYWFRSTPERQQLEALHARIAELQRMPLLVRLWEEQQGPRARIVRARPPPKPPNPQDIPF